MKVLEVFLLAALGCSLTEAWLVSKCDLKDQLLRATDEQRGKSKQNGAAEENLVAKLVCNVELTSGFNTSAVTELIPGREDHPRRGRRNASFGGLFSLAELELPSTTPPPARERRGAQEVWTLYGIFQLSNYLVCNDGTTPSPNICGLSCSNLVDDDIRDDINCVLKILAYLLENGFGAPHWEQLRRTIRLIFQEECRDTQASEYFAECS
ncbi:lysozyme C-like [Seriola lalandi dorsalis]|uniref:lysozyme C-like n=1 Tax=Seriola lalandi dorsalis TaxID=1841481 RepID=UPI000C6F51A9|nr:lysozyme C-like [Seriola lalandi dorsalis]XP_056224707.1 lysozyme C-like [Seriola aureovittata]